LDEKDSLDVDTLKSTLGLVTKDFEEVDLENIFKNCGEVVNVRMPEDRMKR
jgi:RNA recognition motif-containing protein